ncbi:hypothetical protein SAMN04488033_10440 [Salegentibacter agarivorans]|uniref:Carbohydrate binding domain-containing protein n=1 Tax=Salegentibacter agarivorans TaxID=345907 RepID=A0A1I2KS69_9FLAO|nr:hypothetical protein [Salegentibacter agarivorans]SFF67961.1 hypothetical protein SAMN04488033_10440 [Salegentibacter agarivorans]
MKKYMKYILLLVSLPVLVLSCEPEEYDIPNEFSDAMVYTSQFRNEEFKIGINDFITFSDLSQNAIEHTWTIEEGSFFLDGDISRQDTIYDEYIVNPGSTQTTDKTAHVLFTKSGFSNVRLYNVFKDSVAIKGKNDTLVAVRESENRWVIDTTFRVEVYDTIVPKILVRQDGIVLNHESDTITVEAGSALEFVDLTTVGRPDTRMWTIAGETSTDSVATIQLNRLGEFNGSLRVSRQEENIPPDSDFYRIPTIFKVIPSSEPFIVSGEIMESEDQTIQISVNGELANFADQEEFFTVKVNGEQYNISAISINQSDATQISIKLVDPIYRDDVVEVSYTGSDITSTDSRVLQDFTDLQVSMNQHEVALFTFEENGNNWTLHETNKDDSSISISTEQAASGPNSLKVESGSSGNWTAFENLVDQFSLIPDQKVQYEYKVYKTAGVNIPFIAPWIAQDGETGGSNSTQYWHNDIASAPAGEWVTIRPAKTWSPGSSADNLNAFIRHSGVGTIYFDDVRIIEVDERP